MNNVTTESRNALILTGGVVILLAAVWILAMSHLIQLPLPLVWIIPFICILLVAVAVLWAGGMFNTE